MSSGEKIRKWRSFRRMTMPQLSEHIGVPASTIYLWEKNRLEPNGQELAAIADALGVSTAELSGHPQESAPATRSEAALPSNDTAESRPGEASFENRHPRVGGSFDMMLVTQVYHHVRDEADRASPVELTTARNLLQEGLKIVKERIKELNDFKKASSQK